MHVTTLPQFSNGWCFIDLKSGILRFICVIMSDIEYLGFGSSSTSCSDTLSLPTNISR